METYNQITSSWEPQQSMFLAAIFSLFLIGFILLHILEDSNIKSDFLTRILEFFTPITFFAGWVIVFVLIGKTVQDFSANRPLNIKLDGLSILNHEYFQVSEIIVVLLFLITLGILILFLVVGSISQMLVSNHHTSSAS